MSADVMIKNHKEKIEQYIDSVFDGITDSPEILKDAMYYSISAGGKRIRPVLLLEFYKLLGGNEDDILNFAAAIEMIHTYSLIHDDLPCMDNDDMRRGKPSCHKAFGEDVALLAGDALLTLAFETASNISDKIDSKRAVLAINSLSKAAGMCKMVGGQVIDLQSEGKKISLETLEKLQSGKTVAMLKISAEIACILANADENDTAALVRYCENIGKAFQIRDDILDVIGDSETFGKPVGSDEDNHKNTYVSLIGLENSQKLCDELTKKAIDSVNRFDNSDDLRELAQMLCNRTK